MDKNELTHLRKMTINLKNITKLQLNLYRLFHFFHL